jgi:hypothetical protein
VTTVMASGVDSALPYVNAGLIILLTVWNTVNTVRNKRLIDQLEKRFDQRVRESDTRLNHTDTRVDEVYSMIIQALMPSGLQMVPRSQSGADPHTPHSAKTDAD